METLIKSIEEIKEQLIEEKENYNKKELEFFERNINIFKRNSIFNIEYILPTDIILASIRSLNSNDSFEEDLKKVTYIGNIDNQSADDITVLFEMLNRFLDKGALDELKKERPNNIRLRDLDLLDAHNLFIKAIEIFFSRDRKSIDTLVDLYEKYDKLDVFANLILFNDYKEIIDEYDEFQILKRSKSSKNSLMLAKHSIEDLSYADQLFEMFDNFSIYYNDLKVKTKLYQSELNKKINSYEKVLNFIKYYNFSSKLPIEALSNIDGKIAIEVLIETLEKDKSEYLTLKKEYEANSLNEIDDLDRLLLQYGINYFTNIQKQELLSKNSIENIEGILDSLMNSKLNFISSDDNLMLNTLLFSSESIIQKINALIESNLIPLSFIEKNLGILFDEENSETLIDTEIQPKYRLFSRNLETIKRSNINVSNIKKFNITLLVEDNNTLEQNLALASIYMLNLSDSRLDNFALLEDESIFYTLDQLIELGNKNISFEYLKALRKNDKNFAKRCILANYLSLPIIDNNGYIDPTVANKNKFYVSDGDIDKYILNNTQNHISPEHYSYLEENSNNKIDESVLKDSAILFLDSNYKIDELAYNISGIRISRNRVLRNLTSLKYAFNSSDSEINLLNSALLYNSILSEEKIQTLLEETSKFESLSKEKKQRSI